MLRPTDSGVPLTLHSDSTCAEIAPGRRMACGDGRLRAATYGPEGRGREGIGHGVGGESAASRVRGRLRHPDLLRTWRSRKRGCATSERVPLDRGRRCGPSSRAPWRGSCPIRVGRPSRRATSRACRGGRGGVLADARDGRPPKSAFGALRPRGCKRASSAGPGISRYIPARALLSAVADCSPTPSTAKPGSGSGARAVQLEVAGGAGGRRRYGPAARGFLTPAAARQFWRRRGAAREAAGGFLAARLYLTRCNHSCRRRRCLRLHREVRARRETSAFVSRRRRCGGDREDRARVSDFMLAPGRPGETRPSTAAALAPWRCARACGCTSRRRLRRLLRLTTAAPRDARRKIERAESVTLDPPGQFLPYGTGCRML